MPLEVSGKRGIFHFWKTCVIALWTAGLFVTAGETPTILAIGDSMTQGGKCFVCYRQVLIPELRKRNVAFEFVGPRYDVTFRHAGYGGKNARYSYLPKLNKELESLAVCLTKRGDTIVLANHAEGFDWKTDTIDDKVHPNATGAKKMAHKWMEALLPLFEKNDKNKTR